MKKTLPLLFALIMFSCNETPLNEINLYSGSWKMVFTGTGNLTRDGVVIIKDDGTFCNKLYEYPSRDSVTFQGLIDNYGRITGNFSTVCGGTQRGAVDGGFTEVSGVLYGYGRWVDTLVWHSAIGTWLSKPR